MRSPSLSNAIDFLPRLVTTLNDPASSSEMKVAAINAVKLYAKSQPQACQTKLDLLVPPLMERLRDRQSMAAKLAAERALMHVLQIHTNPPLLDTYLLEIDSSAARSLGDYAKRVLAKLAPSSDSEHEGEQSST